MNQQTPPKDGDLNKIVAETAKARVTEYLTSEEFKAEAKREYSAQIATMIEEAEKKARFWAIVVSLLVIGIALVLVSSEFFKVKEKRLSLDEEYVKVLVVAQELRKTIDELSSETSRAKERAESENRAAEVKFNTLSTRADELQDRLKELATRVERQTQ